MGISREHRRYGGWRHTCGRLYGQVVPRHCEPYIGVCRLKLICIWRVQCGGSLRCWNWVWDVRRKVCSRNRLTGWSTPRRQRGTATRRLSKVQGTGGSQLVWWDNQFLNLPAWTSKVDIRFGFAFAGYFPARFIIPSFEASHSPKIPTMSWGKWAWRIFVFPCLVSFLLS